MAIEARAEQPLEIENVKDEERNFGGDIAWWAAKSQMREPPAQR